MPRDPNQHKNVKRKQMTGQKQPDWMFPKAKPALPSADQSIDKENKDLAMESSRKKSNDGSTSSAPSHLLNMVSQFLHKHGFTTVSQALLKERDQREEAKDNSINPKITLEDIYTIWLSSQNQDQGLDKVVGANINRQGMDFKVNKSKQPFKKDRETRRSHSSSSISDSDDSTDYSSSDMEATNPIAQGNSIQAKRKGLASSTSNSSSDSGSEDEKPGIQSNLLQTSRNNLKRKASSSNTSSSSDSGLAPSSDSDRTSRRKRVKHARDTSFPNSDISSSDSDVSGPKKKPFKNADPGSSSSSDSDSESSNQSIFQRIPVTDMKSSSSGTSSDSSSDSDTDSEGNNVSSKAAHSSDTSGTLSITPKKLSPTVTSNIVSSLCSSDSKVALKGGSDTKIKINDASKISSSAPLPPDPISKGSRKGNVPFSRISNHVKVDDRLASNAYVPYDYAQRAHEDLVVTKGKGFTKEKNKKKRGSYRGGYIDVQGKKGIKFDE